ncbi:hypothetical protein BCR36DRAFT_317123 [Piromyces finnis]|uniref:G-protein coupled receptors family 2 profile 2 domain-containing protein n=1 Tax=Piromyces finnis TaxID=1754191 RepID=A0A1Y1VL63_9FUNG|nr:hypothetical protein BCR36DRAFT_317123 [Piromyces finnis]|eukprot:ORX59190.1 hypothetical protein BCR36DRAFT_317123 [Piromyces finnis]
MILTDNQSVTLQFIVELSSILSVIGSGSIIISNIFTGNIFGRDKFWNRIIFFMSFWDLCGSINLLLKLPIISWGGNFCKFQKLSAHFFYLNSIFWTAAIASFILFIVIYDKKIKDIQRFEYVFHMVILSLSFVLTLPIYTIEDSTKEVGLGEGISWCWNSKDNGRYKLYIFYIPLWIVFIFNASIYILIDIICNKKGIKRINNNTIYFKNSIVKRSDLYLLVFFITWIWGSVNQFYKMNNENPIFILYLLHAIFAPLQGFLNSLVYFWSSVLEHTFELRKIKSTPMDHHDLRYENNTYNNNFNIFMKSKKSLESLNKYYKSNEYKIQIPSPRDDETITNDKSLLIDKFNSEKGYYRHDLPAIPTTMSMSSHNFVNYDNDLAFNNDFKSKSKHFSLNIHDDRSKSLKITINKKNTKSMIIKSNSVFNV